MSGNNQEIVQQLFTWTGCGLGCSFGCMARFRCSFGWLPRSGCLMAGLMQISKGMKENIHEEGKYDDGKYDEGEYMKMDQKDFQKETAGLRARHQNMDPDISLGKAEQPSAVLFAVSQIQAELFAMRDPKYQAFHARIAPELCADRILGVSVPKLRALSKTLDQEQAALFMHQLPHTWHEENVLHVLLLNAIREPELFLKELHLFYCAFNSWSVTDLLAPKFIPAELLLQEALRMLASGKEYVRRTGIVMILRYGLKQQDCLPFVQAALASGPDTHTTRQAKAWLLCEGMIVHPECFEHLIQTCQDPEIFRMAISKCIDSRRISRDIKERLKGYRRQRKSA